MEEVKGGEKVREGMKKKKEDEART